MVQLLLQIQIWVSNVVSEAVKLVLLSHLATENSNDCFVLDMGKPVKILDIAYLLIKNITGLDQKTLKLK